MILFAIGNCAVIGGNGLAQGCVWFGSHTTRMGLDGRMVWMGAIRCGLDMEIDISRIKLYFELR